MPNKVVPTSVIKEFGGPKVWEYNEQKKTMFCKLCSISASVVRRSVILDHMNTSKHKKNLKLREGGDLALQQTLNFAPSTSSAGKDSTFASDLTHSLVSANIPLHKADHPAFKAFLEKYCKQPLPSCSTMTRIMENESNETLRKVKEKLLDKLLFVSIDETTDHMGRAMCVVLAGLLWMAAFLKDRTSLIW